ncbi:MAG: class I SAM-dependent methyltransferase [Chlamydiales bacterium]|nr:class I SAM-dependent methyltransferase [Chlamydiales bacterium]
MSENPLKVVQVQKGMPHRSHSTHQGSDSSDNRDIEARAYFERQWLLNPEQFDPNQSAIDLERISRTWKRIKPLLEEPELVTADIGFGWGALTTKIRGRGAQVDAVDIAENAIKRFQANESCDAKCIRDTLPRSSLADDAYNIVVCTDLIAELDPRDHRLMISELYRILKPEGHLVCSTPLDYRTDGALERFAALVETEFEVIEWDVSHHAYQQRLLNVLGKFSFLSGLHNFVRASRPITLFLESICRALSPDTGVTHAICVAKLKSLNTTQSVDVETMDPQNQRLRRRVWE